MPRSMPTDSPSTAVDMFNFRFLLFLVCGLEGQACRRPQKGGKADEEEANQKEENGEHTNFH